MDVTMTRKPHRWMSMLMCGVGLAVASCDGRVATNPTSVPRVAAAAASAGTPAHRATAGATQLRFSVDLTVPAYPVCPETPPSAGVITGTGLLTIVMRTTIDGNGGTHLGTTIHGHGTATDATGANWTWTDADLNNELFPSGNTSDNSFSTTAVENFRVIGPQGQKVKVQGTFHITTVKGSTVVEVERGNHEAAEVCESGFVLTPLP